MHGGANVLWLWSSSGEITSSWRAEKTSPKEKQDSKVSWYFATWYWSVSLEQYIWWLKIRQENNNNYNHSVYKLKINIHDDYNNSNFNYFTIIFAIVSEWSTFDRFSNPFDCSQAITKWRFFTGELCKEECTIDKSLQCA